MKNLHLPLLCRSPLRPHESLPSLLIRLSIANAYHSPNMITWICNERLGRQVRISRPTRFETYQALAKLVRIQVDKLYDASIHHFASTVVPPTFEQRLTLLFPEQPVPLLNNYFAQEHTWPESDAQFCPLCLQESICHQLAWMPLAVSVCLTHCCLLVRGCPQCQSNLYIYDVLKSRCADCGFNLTKAPAVDVSTDEIGLRSQMVIQSWLGIRSQIDTKYHCVLPNEPAPILYCFLDGLRKTIMRVKRGWNHLHDPPNSVPHRFFPCTSKLDITPAKSYILYTTAFKGIADWPDGFFRFLDTYKLHDEQPENGLILRNLRYLYISWLEKVWQHPAFQFVQETFDQYLLTRCSVVSPRLRRVQENPVLKRKFFG